MTKDEALKLALEALKHTHPSALTSFYTIGDRDKAIKAIQEHLAQPEQEPVDITNHVSDEDEETCPNCGKPLQSKRGGGVVCSARCGYWFCF